MLTLVRLEDVNGTPVVKMSEIPAPLRVGDTLRLKFSLSRYSNGRQEVLDADGQFRVTAVGFDAATVPRRQVLSVESKAKPPTWRSVKKAPSGAVLGPAKHPRTPII